MSIDDLPENFDESIYDNEYDNLVQFKIQAYQQQIRQQKKDDAERQKMEKYLREKKEAKLKS